MFQACKAALDIIGDCNMNLSSKTSAGDNEMIYPSKLAAPSVPTTATKKGNIIQRKKVFFYRV